MHSSYLPGSFSDLRCMNSRPLSSGPWYHESACKLSVMISVESKSLPVRSDGSSKMTLESTREVQNFPCNFQMQHLLNWCNFSVGLLVIPKLGRFYGIVRGSCVSWCKGKRDNFQEGHFNSFKRGKLNGSLNLNKMIEALNVKQRPWAFRRMAFPWR